MVTKKDIIEFITPLFDGCNMRMLSISHFEVKISIWYTTGGNIEDLIKILSIIKETPYIKSGWNVWREVGYYDSTEDTTMDFIIDKDLIKKAIKNKK